MSVANHPIFYPTFHGQVESVEALLKKDPILVNVRDAKNLKPLHVAASRGQDSVARLLLEYGADVNGPRDGEEWTPLIFASYRGHCAVVKVLLEHGAGLTEEYGNPIHYAGQRKHKEVCGLLSEHGAVDGVIASKDPELQWMLRAVYSFDHVCVKTVLSKRPEFLQVKDVHGKTFLHVACTFGDTRTVRILLNFGADTRIRDGQGQRPVDCASAHRQHKVVKILEQHV